MNSSPGLLHKDWPIRLSRPDAITDADATVAVAVAMVAASLADAAEAGAAEATVMGGGGIRRVPSLQLSLLVLFTQRRQTANSLVIISVCELIVMGSTITI